MKVLGLDPSLTNFGWCLFDSGAPSGAPERCLDRGRFQTSSKTLFIDRYTDLRFCVLSLLDRVRKEHNVMRVGVEYPVFHELYSEGLYGLFLYNCEALRMSKVDVVFFSPGQIKVHAAHSLGRPKGWKMMKPDMVEAAKADAGFKGYWNHNEADAYWAAHSASRFWSLYDGLISNNDLTPAEVKQFTEIRTYVRGPKMGTSKKTGILYREDERFFRWSLEGGTSGSQAQD